MEKLDDIFEEDDDELLEEIIKDYDEEEEEKIPWYLQTDMEFPDAVMDFFESFGLNEEQGMGWYEDACNNGFFNDED